MMKTWKVVLFAAVALVVAAGCGNKTSSGKVLVTINGEKITEGDLKFLGEINPRIQSQIESPEGKQRILDNLVEQDLLYQEAVKEGVNRDALVKAKIDLYRRVIIAQSLVEKAMEDAAKKYYDQNPEEFKKLRLAHIMVKFATPDQLKNAKKGKDAAPMRTEEEALKLANEIKAKIESGTTFDVAAKDSSDDAATKTRGGDLGLVSKGDKRLEARGFAPLVDKAFEMKVGEVAGPIKTQDGYHLITVTRGIEVEPFEEAKQGILFKVRGDSRQELLARLKKDAKIIYPEDADAKKKAEEDAKKGEAAKPGEATPPPAAGEAPAAAPEGAAGQQQLPPEAQQKVMQAIQKAMQDQKAAPAPAAPEKKN